MFIIALPWSRRDLEYLENESDLFDLYMDDSTQQFYLVIQGNRITWIGQGTVPGKMAYQIMTRTFTMNGEREAAVYRGNVGFLGTYSSIEDAIQKLFPKTGYCVSNMSLQKYTGQKIEGNKTHYSVIEPILCLLRNNSEEYLEKFFERLGWNSSTTFQSSGNFRSDMQLYINGQVTNSLENWFVNYCNIVLQKTEVNSGGNDESNSGGCLSVIIWAIIIIFMLKSCS